MAVTEEQTIEQIAPRPEFLFDIYFDKLIRQDIHAGYRCLSGLAPPLFWTAVNDGHWMANSGALVLEVLRRPETFSSSALSIPARESQPRLIPISLDPPEHRLYRQLLRPLFESRAIAPLGDHIEAWTDRLIGAVEDEGRCDFVDAVASRLPVSIFMEMLGLPIDRFEDFRRIVDGYFSSLHDEALHLDYAEQIKQALADLIAARRIEPRDDMASKLLALEFEGRRFDQDELISITYLLFLAGLDTVVSALSFGMRHLASDPALQERIIAEPGCVPAVVEELLRRYAFIGLPRRVMHDTELAGVELRSGEMIYCPLVLVGWDVRLAADPFDVSLDRGACRHAAFGTNIHTCLGLHLARLELEIFYRRWFERIGPTRQAIAGVA